MAGGWLFHWDDWVITRNLVFINCSELRTEVSFLFGLFLGALAQSKLVLFLVILQQMGTNFLVMCLKSLVHVIMYYIMCLECCLMVVYIKQHMAIVTAKPVVN
jgi:hypothetical protein